MNEKEGEFKKRMAIYYKTDKDGKWIPVENLNEWIDEAKKDLYDAWFKYKLTRISRNTNEMVW